MPRIPSAVAILLCLVLTPAGLSQGSPPPGRTCGTMPGLERLRQLDKNLDARMAAIETHTRLHLSGQGAHRAPGSVVVIPVVFHVIYNTPSENITDAQILSQLDVMNEDFRRTNPDAINTPPQFLPVAADTEIEFCLATVDPNNQATNGITRTQTSVTSFSTGDNMKFTSSGGHDAWPAGQYLNFWVCNLGRGLLGYAQFPGGPASTDGIVCDYQATGRVGNVSAPYHLGRTATHEIGHWLNLRHIWGDGPCGVDDFVADTPESDAANFGCPAGHVSCGTVDMVQNYMDYSDDPCFNLYTQGQKTRMQALFAPGGARVSLLTSPGCSAPGVPWYQVNQPGASLTIDGVTGTSGVPAVTTHCFGETGVVALSGASSSLPYDMAISFSALVPSNAGGILFPSLQVINVDMTDPSLIFLSSGTPVALMPPWPGNHSIPYITPAAALTMSLQMIKVDLSSPDQFYLSQGGQLDVGSGGGLPAGPTGDDDSTTITLGPGGACLGPIPFYNTSYSQVFISSNGRAVFLASDTDYSPTLGEALSDNPFVGFWTDLDPSSGGNIGISSPGAGLLRIDYQNVPYYSESTTVSFAIEFDTLTGAIALDNLASIAANPLTNTFASSGDSQFLGITKGNLGATQPAPTLFGVGLMGTTTSANPMIFDFCDDSSGSGWNCGGLLPSLQGGLNRIVFTPNAFGNYDWMAF